MISNRGSANVQQHHNSHSDSDEGHAAILEARFEVNETFSYFKNDGLSVPLHELL